MISDLEELTSDFFSSQGSSNLDFELELNDSIDMNNNKHSSNLNDKNTISSTIPDDISSSYDQNPVQPRNINFPYNNKHKFNPKHYDEFKWIDFSASFNKVYCHVCRHFTPSIKMRKPNASISDGYNDFHNNKYSQHEKSSYHKAAVEARKLVNPLTQLKKGASKVEEENEYYLQV
jgi:hypothetical protein